MKLKKAKIGKNYQVAGKIKPKNQKRFPNDVFAHLFIDKTTPEDKLNLVISKKLIMSSTNQNNIMKNDVLKRRFMRKYGKKLRFVKIETSRGARQILELLLPNIPNVEKLSLNFSDNDASDIQPRSSIDLPNLKKVEVFKPADLKIVMNFAKNSIKCVKYVPEMCDISEIVQDLNNVEELECDYPIAAPPINSPQSTLSLDSVTSLKLGTVHCGSIRALRLPNIKSIEINKLARTDYYLRGFFNSIINVENMKINGLMNREDITDIVGEVARLPLLKIFSLKHAGIFSIFINVEEQRVEVSDHISKSCENIMHALQDGFDWFNG